MEYTFWLDQGNWEKMIKKTCKVLQSQLSIEKLKQDITNGSFLNEDEEAQKKWLYDYVLAHQLVGDLIILLGSI